MPRDRRMGRGLEALIARPAGGVPGEGPQGAGLRQIPLDAVRPNPRQPRQRIPEAGIDALAESIRAQGIVQPILVREHPSGDGFELIAGERRWRAARRAGLTEVPAVVRAATDDAEALALALVENVVREDLNPIDEARACALLLEDLGIGTTALATRLGRSRSALANLIRLLDLPDELLDRIGEGDLSEGHGRALLGLDDRGAQLVFGRLAAHEGWSVRRTEDEVKARLAAGDQPPRRAPLHLVVGPALADAAQEVLGAALGRPVAVKATGRVGRVELAFDDAAALRALVVAIAGEPAAAGLPEG